MTITISKQQLIEMRACAGGLKRFMRETNNSDQPFPVQSLIGGKNTISDLLWLAGKIVSRDKIVRFACDCALINIEMIKPYTDKFDSIVNFLNAPTADDAARAADAAYGAAYAAADATDAATDAAAAYATDATAYAARAARAYATDATAAAAAAYATDATAAAYATAAADATAAYATAAADAAADAAAYAAAYATHGEELNTLLVVLFEDA